MLRQITKVLEPIRNRLFRPLGSSGPENGSFEQNRVTKEQQLIEIIKQSIPGTTYISVDDISGGCGAMYEINIEAKEFIGLSTVKQHRLVTETLKKEIAEMHGIRIHTDIPKSDNK